jgi:hypothetical protein
MFIFLSLSADPTRVGSFFLTEPVRQFLSLLSLIFRPAVFYFLSSILLLLLPGIFFSEQDGMIERPEQRLHG